MVRRLSKADVSGADGGQLLLLITTFEPESLAHPPAVLVWRSCSGQHFDLGPRRSKPALFISAGNKGRDKERVKYPRSLRSRWWLLNYGPGHNI